MNASWHISSRRAFRILYLLLTTSLVWGCEDIDNFDVSVDGETTVPAASPLELILGDIPLTEAFTHFDITQAQGFKNDKYTVDDVDSVRLKSLVMTATVPEGADLSFLGEVIFYAETAGLPQKEIARQDTFPVGQRAVSFAVVRDDLKSYLLAPEGGITVEVLDSSRPKFETTLSIKAVFDVDVNVL
ncbi:MAG: hypothetical protein AUK47_09445 [Deltaproteobacteria bacterium CG2_30_63_29]|nr:MAG: hypothetical protein AUK47_09445 [Deltaproteobacteria bacterium CG2_30_63_29]PJB49352.1 MAG: hypothetical protein CO108_00105 [Deltaproteobacteria bacterium CG_4_9_14_3_um_filter_63_12]